jgi:hypothetical protein
MNKLALIALCGLFIAGCATDESERAASGATTAPANREDMRGSKNTAPGAEGDRQRPAGTSSPSRSY